MHRTRTAPSGRRHRSAARCSTHLKTRQHAFGKGDGHGYMRACCLLYPNETGIAGEKLAESLPAQPEHNATGVIGIAMVSPSA